MRNNKKLPILENEVIIPIVINITNNLVYILKKKLSFFNFILFTSRFFNNSKLDTKQNNKNIAKTVLFIKKPDYAPL